MYFKIFYILLFATVSAVAYYSLNTNSQQATKTIIIDNKKLRTGDIVFRKENNFLSDTFSKIDESIYSHLGIIYKEKGEVYIYHMEYTQDNNDLKKEKIDSFLSDASKVLVYRIKEDSHYDFKSNIENLVKTNPKFDFDFELNNSELYCTEFINEIYKKTIGKDIYVYLYSFKQIYTGISVKGILDNKKLFYKIE